MTRLFFLLFLVVAAALSRLVPYGVPESSSFSALVWHFNPIVAIALFGAIRFRNPWAAAAVPFLAMAASDLVLHATGLAPTSLSSRAVVYATLGAAVFFGFEQRGRPSFWGIAAAGLASSFVFFLVTNFASWAASPDKLPPPYGYPRSAWGLLEAYVYGLPFYRNMLVGTAFYGGLLFGGTALFDRYLAWSAPPVADEPA